MTNDTCRQLANLQAALVAHARQQSGKTSPAVADLVADTYRFHYATLGERYALFLPSRRSRFPERRYFRCPIEAQRAFLAASRTRGRVNLDSATFQLYAIRPDGSLRRLAVSYGDRRTGDRRPLPLFT